MRAAASRANQKLAAYRRPESRRHSSRFFALKYLLEKYRDYDEGTLSKLRGYFVSEGFLSIIAHEIGLGRFVLLGKGEKASGGMFKDSLLCDIFESLVAAIYRDGGYEEARRTIIHLFGKRIDEDISTNSFIDSKSELQKLTQKVYGVLPEYTVLKEVGPEHNKTFVVELTIEGILQETGEGKSKKKRRKSRRHQGTEPPCARLIKKILPVFIPFAGCRNRCVYCNQHKITGTGGSSLIENAARQIEEYLTYSDTWDELAFYGGSFTCLPEKDRTALYSLAHSKGFRTLRFSTSPDCVGKDVLDEADSWGVRTVELGVQSLSDKVLRLNKRPYDSEGCIEAVRAVQERFVTGVQMMTGMYGETAADVIRTADTLAAMKPAYARIYPTVVLADTELSDLYSAGAYIQPPPSGDASPHGVCICLTHFRRNKCHPHRLQYTDSLENSIKGGFYHPAFGDIVKTLIILIYLHNHGEIRANGTEIQKLGGYKALARKHFPDKIITDEGSSADFSEICMKAKENIFENNGRNPERNAASYAEELIRHDPQRIR
ncbi:MAG: radical SAM protein [Geovibrio sp.]|nr:radical SAM protein [Geovibrio sp.]